MIDCVRGHFPIFLIVFHVHSFQCKPLCFHYFKIPTNLVQFYISGSETWLGSLNSQNDSLQMLNAIFFTILLLGLPKYCQYFS